MPHGIRRPRSEYEALLDLKEEAGLSYRELSIDSGSPESTLVLWLTRIRREREDISAFIEVEEEPGERAGVELLLPNGIRIGLEPGFDVGTLQRLVAAVGC